MQHVHPGLWGRLKDWGRAFDATVLADRHGRCFGARGARAAGSCGVPGSARREEAALPRPDQQLDLHPARLVGPESAIWTSALATAAFLGDQLPGGSAYVIGEVGLTTALHEVGYTLTDVEPDFVVLGETRTYSFTAITKAIRLIAAGARFIATNPDVTGPSAEGPLPATGSVAAMITKATGREPYFVGKPNPMMFRSALNRIEAHSENTYMVGDRMDTDVVAGIEAGLETILVLTGSTTPDDVERYPFRPSRVLPSIAEAVELV
jgi:NagD protein